MSGLLGGGIGIKEEEFGAAGDGPNRAEAGLDAKLPGGVVDCDEVGLSRSPDDGSAAGWSSGVPSRASSALRARSGKWSAA